MALGWKVVVDSRNAPELADFWAAALEYEVEDQSRLIEHLLAAGQLPEAAVAEHDGRRHFRGLVGIRHPDEPFDAFTGVGQGRRLLFQDVPEPRSGKNRLHLDVHRDGGELEQHVKRLEALGAVRVHELDQGAAGHWWIMNDPEGNEFCAT
ncbi:hypothetical protein KIH74_22510 [Kineosporia sp. J2-2]|uniref:Glyoxalase-like domain-containing protein n=1 Tax=Kineosporia corallincola TaxID=2835133 RepID=A0ABS5TL41_9ACTN|nr:VOC family protein [Kineosporia corallincola]MBT0771730.1 hypothetical protein [Kineosporia corallincola]